MPRGGLLSVLLLIASVSGHSASSVAAEPASHPRPAERAAGAGNSAAAAWPRLQPKAYRIGIAPSHIVADPAALFASPELWQEARRGADFYKYYALQAAPPAWCRPIPVNEFVRFCRQHQLDIAVEFGSFVPDGSGQEGKRAAERALRELQPLVSAGAPMVSMHLDGPIYRLLQGVGGDARRRLPLEAVAAQLVVFFREARRMFPDMQIGMITNFPNWDYTEHLPGMLGGATSGSGVTYAAAIEAVYQALSADGGRIDFLDVDCPYQYYVATQVARRPHRLLDSPASFRALQAWCDHRGIAFQLIVNAEPRATGSAGARRFREDTLAYIKRLRADGIFPDAFIIQSWYPEPARNLPESDPDTFMHTAREAEQLIRNLYPRVDSQ